MTFIQSYLLPKIKQKTQIFLYIQTPSHLLFSLYAGGILVLYRKIQGFTFNVKPITVYRGEYDFNYYKCVDHQSPCSNYDGIWPNIQTGLYQAGYQIWSPGKIYMGFVVGAGGWAGANHSQFPNGNGAGFGIMGDWALNGISKLPNDECSAHMGSACYYDSQTGAVAHELGHAFGLLWHPDEPGSVMMEWWNFPYISLLDSTKYPEKNILWSSDFFSTHSCDVDVRAEYVYLPQKIQTNTSFNGYFMGRNYGWCSWETSGANKMGIKIVSGNSWRSTQQTLSNKLYPAQRFIFSIPMKAPTIKGFTTTFGK